MSDQSLMSRIGASMLPQLAKVAFPSDWVAADPATRSALVKRRRSIDGPRPDLILQRKWGRATTEVAGRELHLLTPTSGSTGRVLYYLHGGAFVFGPGAMEWLFATKVADRLGCDLALYDYPKIPEHDSTDIHPANLAAYDAIADRYPSEALLIGGTSAGGALALTTLVQLHRAGRALPDAGVLFSPWLDVTVSHDDIGYPGDAGSTDNAGSYAESDKLLEIDCLRADGLLYAGPNEPTDPLISPRYMSDSELAALPPLAITVGEQEIFVPEISEFAARATAAGSRVNVHVESFGQHAGVVVGTPESTAALDAALDDVRSFARGN